MDESYTLKYSDDVLCYTKAVCDGRWNNSNGMLANYDDTKKSLGWPRSNATGKDYLDIKLMGMDELRHEAVIAKSDAVNFHRLATEDDQKAKAYRVRSNALLVGALGVGGATTVASSGNLFVDQLDIIGMKSHFHSACKKEYTPIIKQCVDEHAETMMIPQPMVGVMGAGIAIAFTVAAYLQRSKSKVLENKGTKSFVKSAIANGNADLCDVELAERKYAMRPKPHLYLAFSR